MIIFRLSITPADHFVLDPGIEVFGVLAENDQVDREIAKSGF